MKKPGTIFFRSTKALTGGALVAALVACGGGGGDGTGTTESQPPLPEPVLPMPDPAPNPAPTPDPSPKPNPNGLTVAECQDISSMSVGTTYEVTGRSKSPDTAAVTTRVRLSVLAPRPFQGHNRPGFRSEVLNLQAGMTEAYSDIFEETRPDGIEISYGSVTTAVLKGETFITTTVWTPPCKSDWRKNRVGESHSYSCEYVDTYSHVPGLSEVGRVDRIDTLEGMETLTIGGKTYEACRISSVAKTTSPAAIPGMETLPTETKIVAWVIPQLWQSVKQVTTDMNGRLIDEFEVTDLKKIK